MNKLRKHYKILKDIVKPITIIPKYNEYGTLMCPCCGTDEGNLHQGRVTVHSPGSTYVTIKDNTISVDQECRHTSIPSDDGRDWLSIAFYCEHCGNGYPDDEGYSDNYPDAADGNMELVIYQYKGSTLIKWQLYVTNLGNEWLNLSKRVVK